MTRINAPFAGLAAALCFITGHVAAEETGAYLGASVGVAESGLDNASFANVLTSELGATGVVASVDNEDTAWKLYGGYKFSRHLAVEAGYVNLGEQTGSATFVTPAGSPASYVVDLDAFQLAVVGSFPISEAFSVFGKVGAYFWRTESRIGIGGGTLTEDNDGNDLYFGLGASVRVTDGVKLRAEWERFDSDDDEGEIDLYTLGASFDF